MNQEKITLNVFIFSITALFLIIGIIIMNSNITGNVTLNEDESYTASKENKCIDTDGMNTNTKGTVQYCKDGNCKNEQDVCSEDKIIEWYCEENEIKSQENKCDKGCDSGACLNALTTFNYPNIIGKGSVGRGENTITNSNPTISHELGSLSSEQKFEASNGEKIGIELEDNKYILTIKNIGQSEVKIEINNDIVEFIVGKEKLIDLNSDSTSDISINIKTINTISNKANMVISKI